MSCDSLPRQRSGAPLRMAEALMKENIIEDSSYLLQLMGSTTIAVL